MTILNPPLSWLLFPFQLLDIKECKPRIDENGEISISSLALGHDISCRHRTSHDIMAADMLQVSVDATIAIAFGLAATIISLITIYIMWKDRSLRMSDSRRGDIEMADQQRPVHRDSQDDAAPMIQRERLDHPHVARLPVTDPHEFHRAVGDFFHAVSRMRMNPPSP
ncbi:hypothetical protein L207DRAFT_176443 [Hyaloscypha variabilis F]|uniref:Uncharacterized protein n=1 Tax=Hyaloscypha variabilis (strain UAMH 11265 / GT02V1 / F) TaxID=1149755 RepID=A0A2J6R223_HYAVF|nr:hypothetical protein L207DRAFT_176443 [Hyaloscypha variabilis F]